MATPQNPQAFFEARHERYQAEEKAFKRQYDQVSTLRVLVFVVTAVLVVFLANERNLQAMLVAAALGLVVFVGFIRRHRLLRYKLRYARQMALLNQQELHRLRMDLSALDAGTGFVQPDHPYTSDLDIFGPHSVYAWLARAATDSGRRTLAQWLQVPAPLQAITARQEAIQAAAQDPELLQDFLVVGRVPQNEHTPPDPLLRWVRQEDQMPMAGFMQGMRWLIPILAGTTALLWAMQITNYLPFVAVLAIGGGLLARLAAYAAHTQQATGEAAKLLATYAPMLAWLEQQPWANATWQKLQANVQQEGHSASKAIKGLQGILHGLDGRGNMLYWIINPMLLLDVHWLIRADAWRKRHHHAVERWFEALGEAEALASVACTAYAEPTLHWPVVEEKPHLYQAQQLGHPLIATPKRVSNDFMPNAERRIRLVTGSNMSGKSTFLRTIGVNAVLAYAGAPVCAQSLRLGRMQVFTSMRTGDDLSESVSSFYAELKRLRQLLDLLEQPQPEMPVLFLLDEILKGTNSDDRHKGAVGLTHQLAALQASGFISTHDLALGRLAKDLNSVANYSFNSTIQNNEILFDYTLTPGLCHSFNASKLMEKMGIQVAKEV